MTTPTPAEATAKAGTTTNQPTNNLTLDNTINPTQSKEGTPMTQLKATTGRLSNRIKILYHHNSKDEEVIQLVNEYIHWYNSPGYPNTDHSKDALGRIIWDQATNLMSRLDSSPDREDKEDTDMGNPTVNDQPDDFTVTIPISEDNMDTYTSIRSICYGNLATKVLDVMDRAEEDPEVARLANVFWHHWNTPYSPAKNSSAAGLHRWADSMLIKHRTFSESVGELGNAILDGTVKATDKLVEVLGRLGESSAKNIGVMAGATIRGASGGIREFQSARMELTVANATDVAHNQLQVRYQEAKLTRYTRRLQVRAARKSARDAVRSMVEDAVGPGE